MNTLKRARRKESEVTITDTVPEEILEGVHKYYARNGFEAKSMTLVSSRLWSVVYVEKARVSA